MFTNSTSPFGAISPVVKNLLVFNLIGFVGSMIFDQANRLFGVYYPDSSMFHWWQIITYMFMHGGFAHLFFNMFALFMFGPIIEQILGAKRFINFYLITGLGALALQFFVQGIEVYQIVGTPFAEGYFNYDPVSGMISSNYPGMTSEELQTVAGIYHIPMVGASGAIFGLLVAFGYLFPNTSLYLMFIPVPVKAKYFIPIYILIELFLGVSRFAGDSVAHFAHLGGALFGFILLKAWGIGKTQLW
ncbi:rhomboid family intramembrane serine protease [Albibacterium indicum]|uniref:rhomboid family intramembrane serine protease n=1 Tax=Albibacterium indicum TaxID=2292082 RepID=UPI000E517A9B|nr:rhomboid family intramembrane serine protease [Pedobacter indicus]